MRGPDMKTRRDFARRFRELMKRAGHKGRDAASAIGVGESHVSQYRNAVIFPSLSTLGKIARTYGVTVSHLLGEDEQSEGYVTNSYND